MRTNLDIGLFVVVFLMVINATFANISVISWWSVLLVEERFVGLSEAEPSTDIEETGGPGENHRPVASHRQTLSHNVVHLALITIRPHKIRGDRH